LPLAPRLLRVADDGADACLLQLGNRLGGEVTFVGADFAHGLAALGLGQHFL
jgi:hypothetical protein